MAIARLSIDLEARLASLQAGLDKAGVLAERNAARIGNAYNGLKAVAASVGGALAAGLSVSAITQSLRDTAALGTQISRLAELSATSADTFQALAYGAKTAGIEQDKLADILKDVQDKVGDFLQTGGGPLADFFENIAPKVGVTAKQFQRLSGPEALQLYVSSLEKANVTQNEMVFFLEAIANDSSLLLPLLQNNGQAFAALSKEARDLGAVMSDDLIKSSREFQREMQRLDAEVSAVGRAVAAVLLPAITEFFSVLRGNGPGAISSVLAVPLQAVTVLGGNVAFVLKGIGVELGGIAAQAAAVAQLDFSGAAAIGRAMREDAAVARAEFDAWERRILQLGTAPQADFSNEGRQPTVVRGGGVGAGSGTKPTKPGKPAAAGARPDSYDDAVTRAVTGLIERTDTVKLTEITAQFAKLDQLAAAGLDPKIVEDVRRLLNPPDLGNVGPPISAELEKINALLAETSSARLAEAQRTVTLLNNELSRTDVGTARFVQLQEAILDAQDQLTELAGTFPEVQKVSADLGRDIGATFNSAFESAVLAGEKFGDVLRGLAEDLLRLFIRRQVLEPLATGTGKFFTSLLGSAKGNAFGPAGVIPFATGGVVNAPTLFGFGGNRTGLMGEAGPEAILPLRRGRDGRLGVSGVGGVTIHQTINVQAGASRNDVVQAAVAAKNAAVAEIREAQRRGGRE